MPDKQLEEFLSLVEVDDFDNIYSVDIKDGKYFGFPLGSIIEAEKRLRSEKENPLAYFSMEYGLATSFYNRFQSVRLTDSRNKVAEHEVFSNYRLADYFFTLKLDSLEDLPIYSGGLGVLAGDTLKTMADYHLPAVGVGILWNTGYFRQRFFFKYGQFPEAMHWHAHSYPGLVPLKNKVVVSLRNCNLYLKLWKYYVYSYKHDYVIPLVLLDADVPENEGSFRRLTDQLYRSESLTAQIMQRIVLGMGGALAVDELKYKINTYHMNEGHAVFAFVGRARGVPADGIKELSQHFVYTCHTPVAAGHDRYPVSDLSAILKSEDCALIEALGKENNDTVNLTLLSINASRAVNAVALSHQRVMHLQFPRYKDKVQYVTNGVHSHTWMSDRFKALLEKYSSSIGDVRANPMGLDKTKKLASDMNFRFDIWQAHQENKADFCNMLEKWKINKDVLTICWARRIASYKRPGMILQDAQALIDIAKKFGPLQVILAGKAHPKDNLGFTYINQLLDKIDQLSGSYDLFKIVMLENYGISIAKKLISSVDIWLNNPLPPFEASGTSGMKAILNGVLQVSTLDGWVVEAEDKGIGKIFGYRFNGTDIGNEHDLKMNEDSRQLYDALGEMARIYYTTNKKGQVDVSSPWIDMMINCLCAGAYFNTYRMLDQYKEKIWKRKD
ncbi:MAG: alpha-glucan family phosphorylase [Candidatus Omnitrophica bacterium]|jgi:starch phosphorylase|nr:alpha-glucan family phosphorylase [Candidatus Omnitrophota bacterium]